MKLSQLRIAAWNACGIKGKREELKQFMSNQNRKVMLIGEAWLRPGDTLTVPNFFTYRVDRLTGGNGGVAVLVKKELQHVPRYVHGLHFLESAEIKIPLRDLGGLLVYSVYAPPSGICDWNDLRLIFAENGPALAAGDFNAKHSSWGCRVTKGYGRKLYNHLPPIPISVSPRWADIAPFSLESGKELSSVTALDGAASDLTWRISQDIESATRYVKSKADKWLSKYIKDLLADRRRAKKLAHRTKAPADISLVSVLSAKLKIALKEYNESK